MNIHDPCKDQLLYINNGYCTKRLAQRSIRSEGRMKDTYMTLVLPPLRHTKHFRVNKRVKISNQYFPFVNLGKILSCYTWSRDPNRKLQETHWQSDLCSFISLHETQNVPQHHTKEEEEEGSLSLFIPCFVMYPLHLYLLSFSGNRHTFFQGLYVIESGTRVKLY